MRKKKILVVGASLGIGGVEKALLGLVNSYDYSQYQVDLLLIKQDGLFMQYLNKEVRLLKAPSFFSWISLPKGKVLYTILTLLIHPIYLYFFLKNVIWGVTHDSMAQARQRVWKDVISFLPMFDGEYSHVLDFTGLYRRYVLDKVQANEKSTWIHSDYRVFGLDEQIDYQLLKRFDHINCVSDTCKVIFDDVFPDLKAKSKVCLNIVDMALIQSQLTGQSFDDGFQGVRLLDVTRIDPNKGLDIAVQVCSNLKRQGLVFKWYILGNDPLGYCKTLESLITEYKVEDCFILLGFTSNPYPYMNDADLIVHFSRFEGRSVSIDEALALKKIVLLTNYPTAKDQITDGVNGYICDFNVNELTECIYGLIKDKEDGRYK